MKGLCFGNPKGSFLSSCIFKVLPKEAAGSLPSNPAQKRNSGKTCGRQQLGHACVPTQGWKCASSLALRLLLGPWSLCWVTNHRRAVFGAGGGVPATSSSEAVALYWPPSTSQVVLPDFAPEKGRMRKSFMNLFPQPRAYSRETESDWPLLCGELGPFWGGVQPLGLGLEATGT